MLRSVDFRNEKVYYELTGKGTPVVLIHGFAEDQTIWEKQVLYFNNEAFQLIIPDLPGSGLSRYNPFLNSIDDHAGAINEILMHEEVASVIMIGHSMGGYISLAFAEKHPEKLLSMGLFHSSAYADDEEKKNTRRKGIEFIQQHGSAKFLQQATPNLFCDQFKEQHPEVVDQIIERYTNFNPESLVHYYNAMMTRPDRTDILKKFTNPFLFIMGVHDNAIPLQISLRQCHLPLLSYIHIAKDSAHMGMLEESEKCNQVMQKFFNLTANSYPPSSL